MNHKTQCCRFSGFAHDSRQVSGRSHGKRQNKTDKSAVSICGLSSCLDHEMEEFNTHPLQSLRSYRLSKGMYTATTRCGTTTAGSPIQTLIATCSFKITESRHKPTQKSLFGMLTCFFHCLVIIPLTVCYRCLYSILWCAALSLVCRGFTDLCWNHSCVWGQLGW